MPAVDASLAQQPAAQPQQQAAPAVDPMAAQAPAMGQAMPEEPEGAMSEEGEDDSTMSLISQLDPKDKETVRAYVISILNGNSSAEQGEEAEMPQQQAAPQMAEGKQVAFTKKQMNELFRKKEEKKDEPKEVLPKHKDNNSPWATPKFDK